MGIPPRRTALRAAHSRHSTRSKHTHTTIAAHTQTKAKMNAATLALLPSAAAAAWYQPMSRYSYTPQVRYYTSDPFWPGSSFASPWHSALSLPLSLDLLASRTLSLHQRMLDQRASLFDDLFDEVRGVLSGGWRQDGDHVCSSWRLGTGIDHEHISAQLDADGKQLTISGMRAPGHTIEGTINLPFSVQDVNSLALEYSGESGVLSVCVPKTAVRQPTPVVIATAPSATNKVQQQDAAAEPAPPLADDTSDTVKPRDEEAEEREQAMLDEMYAFVKEIPQSEAASEGDVAAPNGDVDAA